MKKIKNIACIGAGYVGGPSMSVFAENCPNINFTIVDKDVEKINAWNGNVDNLPIYEPGLKEIIRKTRNKNLFFSNDIDNAIINSDIIFLAVNTPTLKDGPGAGFGADLRYIISCAEHIARIANSDKIIVEKSTVPIRTAEKIKEILDQNVNGIHFEILSNPEFLAEGTAIKDMLNPDRVLIGGDNSNLGQKAIDKLVEIYSSWVPKNKILTTNVWSSELAKLASNAMLAQRISSINSLSALCDKTGAEIDELSRAIGMDHRIGPHFLKVSVGFGGSCFQKDILNLVYLCKYYGLEQVAEYWHQVVKMNNYQKERFAHKIIEHFDGDLMGKTITILGWAFKANTNDSRESASIYVTEILFKAGANILVYDPKVKEEQFLDDINSIWNVDIKGSENNVSFIKKPLTHEVDAVVILTEWEEFKNLGLESNSNKIKIFDGRNILMKNKSIIRL